MGLRQLPQALTLLPFSQDGDSIEDQGLPSDVSTFELGPPHAGAHPLDDQAAFEFGDCADDYDDRPAQRPAGDRWVKTTCGYCSVGCGMLIGVKDGKAVAARGNPDHPVNRGKLCPKGFSEHHILDAPGRATQPLLRKDGKLEPSRGMKHSKP
jgi:hypothetical protein